MGDKNIELLWKKVINKKVVIEKCSEVFGGSELSKATNWFSRYYSVPDKYKDDVIQIIETQLQNEKKLKAHG